MFGRHEDCANLRKARCEVFSITCKGQLAQDRMQGILGNEVCRSTSRSEQVNYVGVSWSVDIKDALADEPDSTPFPTAVRTLSN